MERPTDLACFPTLRDVRGPHECRARSSRVRGVSRVRLPGRPRWSSRPATTSSQRPILQAAELEPSRVAAALAHPPSTCDVLGTSMRASCRVHPTRSPAANSRSAREFQPLPTGRASCTRVSTRCRWRSTRRRGPAQTAHQASVVHRFLASSPRKLQQRSPPTSYPVIARATAPRPRTVHLRRHRPCRWPPNKRSTTAHPGRRSVPTVVVVRRERGFAPNPNRAPSSAA